MNELVLGRLQQLMNIREGVENLTQPIVWNPAADWADEGTHLLLLLDVPGIDADSISLSESDGTVTISGERSADLNWLSTERPQGSFNRTLAFPEEVVQRSGQASLVAGVLAVRFEKKHPTIDVSSESAE